MSILTRRRRPIVLTWPPRFGAAGYRLLVRDATTDELVVKREVDGFSAAVQPEELHPEHRYEWRVQALSARFGEWEELLPYLRILWPELPPAHVLHLRWPASDAPSRVLVRDATADRTIVKDGLLGYVYPLDRRLLVAGHAYQYAVQSWRDGAWRTAIDYTDLPVGAAVTAEPAPAPRVPSAAAGREPHLYLWTCDTEVNMRYMRDPDPARGIDHQVFCRDAEGRDHGIGLMMDRLEALGMRGTFFVDILLEHQFGQAALERVIEAVAGRGHDIQLHLHPSPNLLLSGDPELAALAPALTADDPDLFRRALALSVGLFERRVGRAPVAYRSGAYHLCDAFLAVLPEFGIGIDTSLNRYKNCRVSPWMRNRTQPFAVSDRLTEVPVTWFAIEDAPGALRRQQLAPVKSGRQQDAVSLFDGEPSTFVYLAHSFSFLDTTRLRDPAAARAWNDAYGAHCPPDRARSLFVGEQSELAFLDLPEETDRLELMQRQLETVARRDDVRACTFAELAGDGLGPARWREPRALDPVPVWHSRAGTAGRTGVRIHDAALLDALESAPVTTPVA
jgi:hypothetical protein